MESLLIEIAKSSPASILSLVMVYMFLRFMRETNEKLQQNHERLCTALEHVAVELQHCQTAHRVNYQLYRDLYKTKDFTGLFSRPPSNEGQGNG